jgi:LysR family transcriptional regulator (chromosome initiation inhibitor)
MQLDPRRTQALLAVIDTGSFEQAAAELHLTASAVSQRVRALETALGTPLVVRTRPCRTTPAGQRLMQYLRRVKALEEDLRADFTGGSDPLAVTIAVNADTLASWLLPALAGFIIEERILLDLTVDDQDHTYALLEAGLALGCVSTEAKPMRGCQAQPLGIMRYRCMAAPAFRDRWFAKGMTRAAVQQAPVVEFNRKDRLQADFLQRHYGLMPGSYASHFVPASEAFMRAIELGLGWGMLPEVQMAALQRQGTLVDIAPHRPADVRLFWHTWKVQSPRMELLSEALLKAAGRVLR